MITCELYCIAIVQLDNLVGIFKLGRLVITRSLRLHDFNSTLHVLIYCGCIAGGQQISEHNTRTYIFVAHW